MTPVHEPTTPPAHRPNLARRVHWRRVAAFLAGLLLALSFILALLSDDATSCTERACLCSRDGSQGQEVPCNTCATTDKLLVTGVFDLVRECASREYVTCPDEPAGCLGDYCEPASREVRPTGECSLRTATLLSTPRR